MTEIQIGTRLHFPDGDFASVTKIDHFTNEEDDKGFYDAKRITYALEGDEGFLFDEIVDSRDDYKLHIMKIVTGLDYYKNPQKSIFGALSASALESTSVFYDKLQEKYPEIRDEHSNVKFPKEIDVELTEFIFTNFVKFIPETNTYHVC